MVRVWLKRLLLSLTYSWPVLLGMYFRFFAYIDTWCHFAFPVIYYFVLPYLFSDVYFYLRFVFLGQMVYLVLSIGHSWKQRYKCVIALVVLIGFVPVVWRLEQYIPTFLAWPFVLQSGYLLIAYARKWSKTRKVVLIVLLLMFPLISLAYSIITPRIHWREMAPLGAWTNMMLVGGPSRLHRDARRFWDTASSTWPPPSEWPPSIRALSPEAVYLYKTSHLIDIHMAAHVGQFGFLISPLNDLPPDISGDHKIWMLADGIYFYLR